MVAKARKSIGAGEFKAKCLRLIDELSVSGELIITKRGRPVARLVPMDQPPEAPLAGLILEQGDLVSPIGDAWDAEDS